LLLRIQLYTVCGESPRHTSLVRSDYTGVGAGGAKIWAKMVLEVLWFEKMRPTRKEMQSFFWSYSLEYFSGKFKEIWAKILRTPKNLPATIPISGYNHR